MRFLSLAFVLVFCTYVRADTIYLCNAWAGGSFWSTGICSTQKAHLDRPATVPDGMPFLEQVEFAKQQINATRRLYEPAPNASPSVNTSFQHCARLSKERRAIEEITEKMIWVPIEKQNANYHRMNQIKADMARLGCRY